MTLSTHHTALLKVQISKQAASYLSENEMMRLWCNRHNSVLCDRHNTVLCHRLNSAAFSTGNARQSHQKTDGNVAYVGVQTG